MERIVIAHLGGPKANQEEKFPLSDFKEITIGRDPSSSVRYGEDPKTVVSRQHVRITRNIALPSQFFITDLDSRNGTFVNGQRIVGTISLKPGDVVQCGVGGPEFRFIIEPETGQAPAPTAGLLEHARAQQAGRDLPLAASSGAPIAPAEGARVERMSVPAKKRSSKGLIAVSGVLMGIVALGGGFLFYRSQGASSSGEVITTVTTPQPEVSPTAEASPTAGVEKLDQAQPSPEAEKNAQATPLATATPATNAARPASKIGSTIPGGKTVATRSNVAAPTRRKAASASVNKVARPSSARITNASGGKIAVKGGSPGKISSKGKETINSDNDIDVSDKKAAKKAKKAKKEEKIK
jgi:hypothetical protein